MPKLFPGKGFNGDATEESLTFINDCMFDIISVYQQDFGPNKVSGDAWADEGNAKDIIEELLKKEGWEKEQDSYGLKAFMMLGWGEGAYRVTLVLLNSGSLKVDIRQWYSPKA